jgi:tol-pal system protein YbgF
VTKLASMLVPLLLAACASTPPEQDPVQQKLNELEARMEQNSASNAQLSQRLDELQNSIRELRGRTDELEHGSEALSKQQRDLYSDLDKRLGSGSAAAAGGGAAAAAGSSGAAGDAGAAGTNSPSSTEQSVYGQAFDALKAGSYSVAITGFKDFLSNYPSSSLADNAQYWLGEAYYVNHDYDSAGNAFRTVLRKWPDSRKAPDSLLKLGYTQFEQKQYPAARATLTDVTRKYPGTDAARLAGERLQRIPGQSAAAQQSGSTAQ